MTRSMLTTAAALAALLICGCQGTQSNTSNAPASNAASGNTASTKPDPKVVEEIKELLTKHDKALSEKNIADVVGTFSTEANTVVLGTGQGERFVGTDAIKAAYTEMFKDYDAGTLDVTCDWKTGGADSSGTTAWMAATCPAKDSLKGVKRDYFLNVSAAAVKGANGWRFTMLHMSNGGDPGPPPTSGNSAPSANSSNSGTNTNTNSSDKK